MLALAAAACLAGCATAPPQHNVYVWNLKRDTPVHRRRHPVEVASRETYSHRHRYDDDEDAPPPPPPPGWYTDTHSSVVSAVTPMPKPRDDVTPQQTAYDTGSVRFVWPVRGRVIAGFGENANGERNDGINIATDMGAPIHAAASGTVSYAGNELKGYGNLVLIRHDDGYITAYAHAERLTVSRGDTVTQGEVIGYAGDTGDVSEPQLHFEIRHGVAPVNPRPLLMAAR